MIKKTDKAGEKPKAAKAASKAAPKAAGRPATKSSKSPSPKAKSPAKSTSSGKTPAKRAPRKKAAPKADLDALGSLPHGYGTDTVFLVAQDPNWLFTYWDIDISRHPGGPCHLRVEDGDGEIVQEISVPFETRNWYVPVKEAGKTYTVEIGYYRGRSWKSIARSMPVATPRNRLSESDQFNFATIPLHMSFQRLVETITHSISGEKNLVPALAQLQEALSSGAVSSGFPLQQREKAILITLLGSEFVSQISSGQWGSEELHSAIYQRLRERLSSGELGELVGRLQLGQAESSLFSMFREFGAELASGSWNLSSAGFAERFAQGLSSWLASWSTAAQSSWGGGASELLQTQSAWSGFEIGSMETLASWNQLSSWLAAVGSSWSGLNLSSLELAALSSWTSSAMSSWGAGAGGSVSSWGGPVDSFGVATARSTAPGLDLRAEITLRGQTDPRARLVVAGNLIDVGDDGSFEHTLRFEEGRGEISIEAISPDGSQTRRTAIMLQPASI
jgi:hypothetical protein